jgi:hypothetical protein
MVLDKKIIIVIFAIAVFLTISLLSTGLKNKNNDDEKNLKDSVSVDQDNKISSIDENTQGQLDNDITDNNQETSISAGGGLGGAGEPSNDASETLNEIERENLPEDLYTQNCGYYYNDYEICAGYCEKGTCVSEERSCYCKQ